MLGNKLSPTELEDESKNSLLCPSHFFPDNIFKSAPCIAFEFYRSILLMISSIEFQGQYVPVSG